MMSKILTGVLLGLVFTSLGQAVDLPSYTATQLQDVKFITDEIERLTALKAELEADTTSSPLLKTRTAGEIRKIEGVLEALRHVLNNGFEPDDPLTSKLVAPSRKGRVLGEKTYFSPPFWRVERAGKKPSYLLGTIHIGEDHVMNVFWLVRSALLDVDVVLTELALDQRAEDFPPVYYLPQGEKLQSLLPPDLYQWVTELYQSRGIQPEQIQRFKVWVVALLLDALPSEPPEAEGEEKATTPTPDPLDLAIYKQARKFGKQVGGLETVEEHAHVFDAMTLEEQVGWLRHRMNAREDNPAYTVEVLVDLIIAYLKGDDERLLRRIEDEYDPNSDFDQKLKKRMLSDRNANMASRILAKLKEPGRSYLFAVGAAHLLGDDGLVKRLQRAGFTLTRVSTTSVPDLPAEAEPPAR